MTDSTIGYPTFGGPLRPKRSIRKPKSPSAVLKKGENADRDAFSSNNNRHQIAPRPHTRAHQAYTVKDDAGPDSKEWDRLAPEKRAVTFKPVQSADPGIPSNSTVFRQQTHDSETSKVKVESSVDEIPVGRHTRAHQAYTVRDDAGPDSKEWDRLAPEKRTVTFKPVQSADPGTPSSSTVSRQQIHDPETSKVKVEFSVGEIPVGRHTRAHNAYIVEDDAGPDSKEWDRLRPEKRTIIFKPMQEGVQPAFLLSKSWNSSQILSAERKANHITKPGKQRQLSQSEHMGDKIKALGIQGPITIEAYNSLREGLEEQGVDLQLLADTVSTRGSAKKRAAESETNDQKLVKQARLAQTVREEEPALIKVRIKGQKEPVIVSREDYRRTSNLNQIYRKKEEFIEADSKKVPQILEEASLYILQKDREEGLLSDEKYLKRRIAIARQKLKAERVAVPLSRKDKKARLATKPEFQLLQAYDNDELSPEQLRQKALEYEGFQVAVAKINYRRQVHELKTLQAEPANIEQGLVPPRPADYLKSRLSFLKKELKELQADFAALQEQGSLKAWEKIPGRAVKYEEMKKTLLKRRLEFKSVYQLAKALKEKRKSEEMVLGELLYSPHYGELIQQAQAKRAALGIGRFEDTVQGKIPMKLKFPDARSFLQDRIAHYQWDLDTNGRSLTKEEIDARLSEIPAYKLDKRKLTGKELTAAVDSLIAKDSPFRMSPQELHDWRQVLSVNGAGQNTLSMRPSGSPSYFLDTEGQEKIAADQAAFIPELQVPAEPGAVKITDAERYGAYQVVESNLRTQPFNKGEYHGYNSLAEIENLPKVRKGKKLISDIPVFEFSRYPEDVDPYSGILKGNAEKRRKGIDDFKLAEYSPGQVTGTQRISFIDDQQAPVLIEEQLKRDIAQ